MSRLKPFTSYQFRVKATNDIGDSDYSEDSEAITTLQDGETIGVRLPHLKLPPSTIMVNSILNVLDRMTKAL